MDKLPPCPKCGRSTSVRIVELMTYTKLHYFDKYGRKKERLHGEANNRINMQNIKIIHCDRCENEREDLDYEGEFTIKQIDKNETFP